MIRPTTELQEGLRPLFESVLVDGQPVAETITEGETLEIPDGQSWYIHLTTRTGSEGEVHLAYGDNDVTEDQYKVLGNRDRSNNQVDMFLHEGAKIHAKQSATTLTGWVVRDD